MTNISLRQEIVYLLIKIQEESRFQSNIEETESCIQIIAFGPIVIPLLISFLRNDCRNDNIPGWHIMLIMGRILQWRPEVKQKDRGRFERIKQGWLDWWDLK